MTITILIQGANLNVVTDPVAVWSGLTCTLKNRETGVGQFTAPASDNLMAAVTAPNNRVSVIRTPPGGAPTVFMSGPIEVNGAYKWSLGNDASSAPPGQVTVTFADNLAYLTERVTYPDPAHASTAQTVDYGTATATNAETVLRNLVNLNAGPGALTNRRVAKLVLGPAAGVGTSIDLSTRFEVLTDVLRRCAIAGGTGDAALGFTLQETGGQLVFTVAAPRDLSQMVRFSAGLGNLRDLETNPQSPTCTVAIVGGDGTGTTRTILEVVPGTPVWRRIEQFVNDAGGDTTATSTQTGEQALADGGEQIGLTATAVDSQFARYGVDYGLNDMVSIELIPGLLISDYVSAVTLTAEPDTGEVIKPIIGTGDPLTSPRLTTLIRRIERRVGRLEGL